MQKVAIEFGEQVLAKSKRKPKSNRKQSLKSQWIEGSWFGFTRCSKEHLVAMLNGGPVIKVRTVERRMMSERYSEAHIAGIRATPRAPNLRDAKQEQPMHEGGRPGVHLLMDVERSRFAEAEIENQKLHSKISISPKVFYQGMVIRMIVLVFLSCRCDRISSFAQPCM